MKHNSMPVNFTNTRYYQLTDLQVLSSLKQPRPWHTWYILQRLGSPHSLKFCISSLILFRPKNAGNVGTLSTPQFHRPTASTDLHLNLTFLHGAHSKCFSPFLSEWCSFSFWMYFHDFDPFPFGGFFLNLFGSLLFFEWFWPVTFSLLTGCL